MQNFIFCAVWWLRRLVFEDKLRYEAQYDLIICNFELRLTNPTTLVIATLLSIEIL